MTKTRELIAAGVAALAVAGGVTVAAASAPTTTRAAAPRATSAADGREGTAAPAGELVRFRHVSVDAGLSPARARLVLLRIRQLYTFWDTGDVRYLHRSNSATFIDHTLPAGRPQGLRGVEQASRTFRAAVPDLRCTVADVLVSGDRVSVRQVYTGHFTGSYDGVAGYGQAVRFDAFDIQQVGDRQIVGDWHLEDNLTFLQQIGAHS